jgi:hypothetical protein
VSSQVLVYLPIPSLYTLHLELLGNIDPFDIFNVCSQAMQLAGSATMGNIRPNLRQLRVVGHETVATSVIGTFSNEYATVDGSAHLWESSNYAVTLDRQAIDDLSHLNYNNVAQTRILTGPQIVELSRKLELPLTSLIPILDGLKVRRDRMNG